LRRGAIAFEQHDGNNRCDKKRNAVSGPASHPFPPLWPRNEQCPPHLVKHGDFTSCGAIVAA
jgi:hypothetical protein